MSDWISVDEKLPRVRKSGFSDYVIVLHSGFHVSEGRIRNHTEWRNCVEQMITPTHWMAMPPVPRN